MLCGLMGAGKTAVGRPLAATLSRVYWDNDDALVRATGRTAARLVLEEGAVAAHRRELEVLAEGLRLEPPAVLGAAAAAVDEPQGRSLLRSAFAVWLRARPETLAARLAHDDGHRPFLRGDLPATLREMERRRAPLFREVARLVLDVDEATVGETVDRIRSALPLEVL